MADVVEGTDDPTKAFLSTAPIEDSGAPTQARFEWQNAMASAELLAGYADWLDAGRPKDFDFKLICEWHEDWILHRDGQTELVSAKHREPGVGALSSYRTLLKEGGALHLLQNWQLHQQVPTCRLVTTSELGGDARDVGKACGDFRSNGVTDASIAQHANTLDVFARTAERLDDQLTLDRPTVAQFLSVFQVDGRRPTRDYVDYAAPTAYAAPVARLLNKPGTEAAIWRAVLSVVRPKMQGNGPTLRAALPDPNNGTPMATVAKRIVTLDEVDLTVSVALERADGYEPPPRVYDTTNLGIKMTVAHLSDNVVAHAQRLRRRYVRVRDAALEIPGESDRFETVELQLLQLVRRAEQMTGTNSTLWYELEQRLEVLAETSEFNDLDIHSLTGAIADLCEQCEVWFSDRFGVPEARNRIAAGGHP